MQVIRFDRDRYHQIEEMQTWCRENIGGGGWTQGYDSDDWVGIRSWSIDSTFGVTRFRFKHDIDATFFLMQWK